MGEAECPAEPGVCGLVMLCEGQARITLVTVGYTHFTPAGNSETPVQQGDHVHTSLRPRGPFSGVHAGLMGRRLEQR